MRCVVCSASHSYIGLETLNSYAWTVRQLPPQLIAFAHLRHQQLKKAPMSTPSEACGSGGIFIGAVYVLAWEYLRHRRGLRHYEAAYWAERRGRARVELEMKKLSEVQLNTSEGFFVQPIGHIESCYRQCVGTPRQGMLVPSSRARLVLTANMSPESLDGLDEFSHVWLTFKFHLNTNTLKEAKAFSGTVHDSQRSFTM